MRYVAAVLALILGGVALFVGIAQQTMWAPSQTATATITQSLDDAPVTLIRPDVQAISKEPVEFTITSETPFVAALGRTGDVNAWVKGSAYNELTGIEETEDSKVVTAVQHDGAASIPAPASSDLWVAQQESQGQMVHQWTVPDDGPWTLVLASKDGKGNAPVSIEVSWADPQDTPWSIPLIVIGSILLLLGLGLLGWAISKARAATSGAGSSKSVLKRTSATVAASSSATVAILALAVTSALPANASSAAPSSSEGSASASETTEKYPVVLPEQLDTILGKIATTVNAADKSGKIDAAKSRLDEAALSLRTYSYKLSKDDYEFQKPSAIVAGPVRSSVVTTDGTFPRRIMVATQKSSADLPQILTIEQKTARSNYKLINAVDMLPGAEFPGVAIGDTSVGEIADDASGLKATPEYAINALSKFLGGGSDPKIFAASDFITQTREDQAELKEQGEYARFYFRRLTNPERTVSFRTPDGGALVTAYYQNQTKVRPRAKGDSITLDESTARMAGTTTTTGGVDIKYVEPVVIYIPPADSEEKITLVGANVLQYQAKIVARAAPID
ncbi:hypothetical protein HD598_002614 [Neomicrococcus aestuarii]|uniref:DUF8094 domain-containing protein n=1 Tax=Neomicrococcus aestuarii TaxID=556325 RepID=A0A7W8TW05_9MICC|nr:hypothetical protein [Neomicrococcus aestuarii]